MLLGLTAITAMAERLPTAVAATTELEVWKSPACGCCQAWVEHLERDGFTAIVHETDDLNVVRRDLGIPADVAGCHVARLDGYVLEGHVPDVAVRRLLRERPSIQGLSVPGMPSGSPGMEVPGVPAEAFDVIAFDRNGLREIFLQVRPIG
ncbi:DUF411 domain-containing protein [Marinivivus vitaminiproducens]|uniref:DUF411 domain-containing protein n=1 Tax=Marinivivus vitaminiproducens TaxID=3035935 RepID=UPI00279B6233|nr:DUF411 domain-containing protein [Geminicoccaceae bacterium SCSIO 64248]